ncbi:heterokaryon incompatibility protein-domain-containing protein [Stachybotrys elegans]|uniref:Heterokaryon incompatibility protein-domain-containing protein n=1 Tax=Stachybotrys elegans TaxID=80388 RepID=A0A8K0WPC1_9HYPO|nr:heterokaryon incompatibility protein-domain-containing protein [Stachybotrys elegans]
MSRGPIMDFTQKHLDRCKRHHARCKASRPWLPKRLVKIEPRRYPTKYISLPTSSGELVNTTYTCRLVETKDGETGDYTALSYSWGDKSQLQNPASATKGRLKLKESNRDKLLKNIPLEQLAKSRRQGIQVAWELNYEYIWIDALCIMQDSNQDWAEAAKHVPAIYGNADLTILAGRSDNAHHGFLSLSSEAYPSSDTIQVKYSFVHETHQRTCFVGFERSREVGPASSRGWCFQEAAMARRMIIYGQKQLSFRCRERIDFEDGHFQFIGDTNHWYDLAFNNTDRSRQTAGIWRDQGLPEHEISQRIQAMELGRLWHAWYQMMGEYSRKNFFDPRDNHAALTGILILMQKVMEKRFGPGGARCVAGIWMADFPGSLLWRSDRIRDKRLPALVTPVMDESQVYRGPSWSWMALQGPIYYSKSDGRGRAGVIDPGQPRLIKPWDNQTPWVKGEWDPSVAYRKKHLTISVLQVRAFLCEVRISHLEATTQKIQAWHRVSTPDGTKEHTILLEKVSPPPTVRGRPAKAQQQRYEPWSLLGLLDRSYSKGSHDEIASRKLWAMSITSREGLLLERVSETRPRFRRLGVYLVEHPNDFYPNGALDPVSKCWAFTEGTIPLTKLEIE